MRYHSDKHINEAIEYAVSKGWEWQKSGPRAHSHSRLRCGFHERGGCILYVWSTPRTPQAHARRLMADIDGCPHKTDDTEATE